MRRDPMDYWVYGLFGFVAIMFIGGIVSMVTSPDWSHAGGVSVWTDPKTGCRYVYGEAGMSPLLTAEGRPDCGRRP